ncbi:MAG: hypothetical protein GX270_03685 [Clostridiaceae bacterium]|jgi:type I restriction enzyme S subunit|nr:hypothetical protein [Clostridiaceae bacterium]
MSNITKIVPKRRFKEFQNAGDWEQCKLGTVVEFLKGKDLSWKDIEANGSHECILYGHLYTDYGMVINNINYTTNSYTNDLVLSDYGDVLIPSSDTTPTGLARASSVEKSGVLLGGDINVLRPKKHVDGSFLSYNINFNKPQLLRLIKGTTVKHIYNFDLKGIDISLPNSIEEELKIVSLFKNIDNLITLQQRKLEKAKALKSAYLSEMFPAEGEREPKRRFAGFTDTWEQRKVGDLTNVASAARVHKEEWASSGVPFFRSSDVVSAYKGNENEKAFISFELYEQLTRVSGKLEKDDILITGGGSIGIPYIVPNNEPLYSKDADLIWVKSTEKFNSRYLYTFFTSPEFRRYLNGISHIGTIAHYTIEQVKETPICLPSIEEQNEIGAYFAHLDNLITLQQRKLEKLQNIKKAYLNEIFI